MKKLLGTVDAAPYAGAEPKTMENWRSKGFGPKFIKVGRKVLYDPDDIEAWRNENRCSSTSQAA